MTPGVKSSCAYGYFRKLQNLVESCKMHRIFPANQKNVHDPSKCSEKGDLHFGINIMHA
jgi:hypothetical protein